MGSSHIGVGSGGAGSGRRTQSVAAGVGWFAPEYGLSLRSVPHGFATWRVTLHGTGPGKGWAHASQEFHNDATGEMFIVGVTRVMPSGLAITSPNGTQLGFVSAERVDGYPTYFFPSPLAALAQPQYGWVISPTVMGWLTGYRMSAAAMLAIARQVRITRA